MKLLREQRPEEGPPEDRLAEDAEAVRPPLLAAAPEDVGEAVGGVPRQDGEASGWTAALKLGVSPPKKRHHQRPHEHLRTFKFQVCAHMRVGAFARAGATNK